LAATLIETPSARQQVLGGGEMSRSKTQVMDRPSNADWAAKSFVWPDGSLNVCPDDTTDGPRVEIAWYEGGRIKITIPDYGPAVIRQEETGEGRDAIIELVPRSEP
jgi:hypothetical protein